MRYSDSWGYDRREEEVFPLNGFGRPPPTTKMTPLMMMTTTPMINTVERK